MNSPTVLNYHNVSQMPRQPLPRALLTWLVTGTIITLVGCFYWTHAAIAYCEVLYKDDIALYYSPGKSEVYCVEYPLAAGASVLFAIATAGLVLGIRRAPGRGRWKNLLFILLVPIIGFFILVLAMIGVTADVFSG